MKKSLSASADRDFSVSVLLAPAHIPDHLDDLDDQSGQEGQQNDLSQVGDSESGSHHKQASRLNVDLLNSVAEETTAQISELEQQIAAAETELRELVSGADQVKRDYAQLMNWATLYDNCSFEAKKMIAAQFIKAVRVKRSYELEIEFNVSFSEFQRLYLEPEKEGEHKRGPAPLLAFEEKTRQAV